MTGNIFTINHKRDFDFNKILRLCIEYIWLHDKIKLLSKLIERRNCMDNRNL